MSDDTVDPGDGTPEAPTRDPGPPREKRWTRYLSVAAIVTLVTGAGWLAWQWNAQRDEDIAAQEALTAAQEFADVLTNVDVARIDENTQRTLDLSTGQFKDKFAESSGRLRQALVDNRAAATGVVVESAVRSASADTVEVLMFVDQSVRNATLTEPRLDRSRIRMTMHRVDGRWLASEVELP